MIKYAIEHRYKVAAMPQPKIAKIFLNLGKVVWLSGAPGAGKSTTAQLMGRDAGYIYYEADCIGNYLNPFVPTNVDNPTIAAFSQKALKVRRFESY